MKVTAGEYNLLTRNDIGSDAQERPGQFTEKPDGVGWPRQAGQLIRNIRAGNQTGR
jgi:hypothetical protein